MQIGAGQPDAVNAAWHLRAGLAGRCANRAPVIPGGQRCHRQHRCQTVAALIVLAIMFLSSMYVIVPAGPVTLEVVRALAGRCVR